MEIDGKTLGQVAFEAYRAEVQGTAYDGKSIPEWHELHGNRERAHRGWEVAAAEVARYTRLGVIAEEVMKGTFVARDRPTRWVPLADNMRQAPVEERVEGGAVFEPLPPVGDDVVTQARTSVPVEADDETADDAA